MVKAFGAMAVTVVVPPRATVEPLIVMLEFVSPALGIVVLMADAGMLIAVVPADVICPCAFTANVGTYAALP